MRIYLDVSCLNRPFDDQDQTRIRLEAESVRLILERFDRGEWEHVSSDMAVIEISANPDPARRSRVSSLLPDRSNILALTASEKNRAIELEQLGFKAADAVHIACAEHLQADVLLSCDDRLCRLAQRCVGALMVPVRNPLEWLRETENVQNT